VTERDGAGERHAPLVAGVLLALPTLIAHYLPMSDLPLHEGVVGILRHYGDPAYFPPDLYRLNLGHGNQLFHVVAWALSYAVGTIWAVKLVIAATQVAIFCAGARFADHLGRTRWAAVLLAPLALGFTYYWGLVANLVGFAAFLWALPALDRAAADPTPRRMAGACGLLVLLFFAHESVFVTAAGFAAMLALAQPLDRKKTPLRLAPVAFAPAFLGLYYLWSLRFFTRGQVKPPMAFTPFWQKISFLPNVLFGSHDLPAQLMLLGLSLAAVGVLLAARIRSKETAAEPAGPNARLLERLQRFVLRYRFEGTALAFLAAFVVFPFQWNGATLVYERFVGPAWALFVITAAPRGPAPRIAKLAAAVLPLGILLLSWPQFVDADRTFTNLDRVITEIPKNSSVALVSVDRPVFRTRVYSASVGPARTVADRGGRMALSLTISPLSPVQIRPEYRWDEFDVRTLLNGSRALMPSHDLERFGWVIAQSREPEVRDIIIEAFKPDAELVAQHGEWLLLRSTHPQVPLTTGDKLPPRGTETILDRVRYLAVMRYRMQHPEDPAPLVP